MLVHSETLPMYLHQRQLLNYIKRRVCHTWIQNMRHAGKSLSRTDILEHSEDPISKC